MLSREYQRATQAASREGCPPSAWLVELALNPANDERLVDHLAGCSTCAEEYRALRSAVPVPRGAERSPSRASFAIAALIVISAGLGALSLALLERQKTLLRALETAQAARPPVVDDSARQRVAALERENILPQPNTPIIDLLPAGSALRGGAADETSIAPGVQHFTVILNLENARSYPDYLLEIRDPAGSIVWTARGLKRSPHDTFTVHLSRAFFQPGVHKLDLHGLRDAGKMRLAAYEIRIPPP
jgi:hypothetical protein